MKLVTAPRRAAGALQAKFDATRRELADALIERDGEIDLALTALIAREHLLLVGPPGCGKSLLLDSLLRWMHGRKFSILLTKFSVPEEVFGPISIAALKEDRYRRVTAGRLPEAHLAFVDEIWKASSAILNTLLRMLNEGVFENDGEFARVPLRLCVAASNEWPAAETGKELLALLDRFLFRKTVRPIVTAAGRTRLLWERDHTPRLSTTITPEEVDAAHAEAMELPWAPEARMALTEILRELAREGVVPGDRRQRKAVGAAAAYAYLCGADEVLPEHLEVLATVLWDDPVEQPEKAAQVIARIAHPAGMRVNQLLLETETILAAVDVKDLAQAATATAKLGEIDKQLATLERDPRGARARAYVREQIKQIRLGSIEAI
jgi:MoxR-like ATPase